MTLSESARRDRFSFAIKAERELPQMKNVSAFAYSEKIDTGLLSNENMHLFNKYFARLEAIDDKLLSLKSERRTIADWFLSIISEQSKRKPKGQDIGDNQGGINDGEKTLYGMNIKVSNT